MKAAVYEAFAQPITIQTVPDPTPPAHGVVLKVEATGVCRSDWHGWMGHDSSITTLPHVPGHELAGTIVALGKDVQRWQNGARVTLPFVCGCGTCPECASGNHQVCDYQFQPGFTAWGSFAEYVAISYADTNLVALPESMSFTTAASLGCRFATSFRALVHQGRVRGGEWVAVHGCGGVGLSAIMIAKGLGAQVIAVDIASDKLERARELGADVVIHAAEVADVVQAVQDASSGGVHVSLDALGNPQTCFNSVANLRKRGRHVQVGLMAGEHSRAPIPLEKIIAHELEFYGSHGMQAHEYPAMLAMIEAGTLQPERLVGSFIQLEESPEVLMKMDEFPGQGMTIIDRLT
ncbi:MAG: zinc-dependent alcohol dehydrogenase family protein [Anaerolineae bacterium]|nr:zinc-dependent alcohol dehydrogenase family protein [Anaerolineae bacterium]